MDHSPNQSNIVPVVIIPFCSSKRHQLLWYGFGWCGRLHQQVRWDHPKCLWTGEEMQRGRLLGRGHVVAKLLLSAPFHFFKGKLSKQLSAIFARILGCLGGESLKVGGWLQQFSTSLVFWWVEATKYFSSCLFLDNILAGGHGCSHLFGRCSSCF